MADSRETVIKLSIDQAVIDIVMSPEMFDQFFCRPCLSDLGFINHACNFVGQYKYFGDVESQFSITILAEIMFFKVIAGLLLLWIANQLIRPTSTQNELSAALESGTVILEGGKAFWTAIRTIAVADFLMSLDNAIAIISAQHFKIPEESKD